MPENKRHLYVALVKLLDIYNRFDPKEDTLDDLFDLAKKFQIRFDELDGIENFVSLIRSLL